ncbi:PAB-dependent poly(A)-specific ribonuclease subunit 3 [Geranomyces variabilis]|nr:PAB-dependent poly(A)-specific ribonuclease subunit 3 [Geranomyces variabilis]
MSSQDLPHKTPPRNGAKQRMCRNIVIHGFCKFENKGCEYSHDAGKSGSASRTGSASPEGKSKLRVDSPVFTPTGSVTTASAASEAAMQFAAKVAESQAASGMNSAYYDPSAGAHQQSRHHQPQHLHHPPPHSQPYEIQNPYAYYGDPSLQQSISPEMGLDTAVRRMSLGAGHVTDPQQAAYGSQQHNVALDPYYAQQQLAPRQPLQYHLYTTPLPHISNLHPHQKTIHSFFLSDHVREELQRKSEAAQQVLDPSSPEFHRLPAEIHTYHSFYPLDVHRDRSLKVFGYPTWVYKALWSVDGKPYVLRRIEGFRLTNEAAMSSIEGWRRIRHSNIVSVREAFTTKAFGDNSLVFVYDYHPLSTTLATKYFSGSGGGPTAPGGGVPEKSLWSFITQLASALKTIHSAGLAACIIEPSKILITGKNRIRLNCCGIFDMLSFDSGKSISQYQQEDLLHFGQLIVALACGSLHAIHNLPKSIDHIVRHNSIDLKNVILYLLSKPSSYKSVDDVVTMIGPRILHEINSAHHNNDQLEGALTRELENGRLVRLLCKLGSINERPEYAGDRTWSETGDRYLLKLFRDYVFHQVDEDGRPIVDMAHVLQCLNKLDAGVDEKVMLTSRDENSCLIVSYKELRSCVESTFQELLTKP